MRYVEEIILELISQETNITFELVTSRHAPKCRKN